MTPSTTICKIIPAVKLRLAPKYESLVSHHRLLVLARGSGPGSQKLRRNLCRARRPHMDPGWIIIPPS